VKASDVIAVIAPALEAALPGWTVVRGSAHDLADRQADIAVAEATLGGSSGLGRYAVMERWVVRLAVATGADLEASYQTLLDARDAALKAIAEAGNPFGSETFIEWQPEPTVEPITAQEAAWGGLFFEATIGFWIRRAIE